MVFEKLKKVLTGGRREEEEKPKIAEELSIGETKERLKRGKDRSVKEVEKDLQPLLEKISNLQEKIKKIGNSLESSESTEEVHPSIYKSSREAQRLLLKKVNRAVESAEIPLEPDWGDLLSFNRSLQDANNLLKNAIVSHGNQVAMLFEGKVDRLRRLLDRLQTMSKDLNTALRKKKLELDDFDDLSEDISERERFLEKEKNLRKEKKELEKREQEIESNLEKKESSLESLKRSQRFKELEEIEQKIKELARRKKNIRKKIDSKISDLARPLRKMDKLIERNEHMVSRKVLDGLDSYLNSPVKTALSEDNGLPKLRAVLQELEDVLHGKMQLSDRERRKRLEEVRDIIENEKIERLRKRYFQVDSELKGLRQERESSPLLEKKSRLEKSVQRRELELKSVEKRMSNVQEELFEITEQIKDLTGEIKRKAKSLLDVEIRGL